MGTPKLILVLSGKGGVGKSTVALGTALALARDGTKVGVLDCDLENPCLAEMTRADPEQIRVGKLISPLLWNGVQLMGLSFLSRKFREEDMPVLIVEQRKHFTIDQMLDTVDWDTDILIVDMPPGSGEEVRAFIPKDVSGCIIVTSPQRVSERAVARTVRMCRHYKLPILGLVENDLNSIGGEAGKSLSKKYGTPLIATIPWDGEIPTRADRGEPIPTTHFEMIAEVIHAQIEGLSRGRGERAPQEPQPEGGGDKEPVPGVRAGGAENAAPPAAEPEG